MRMRTSGCVFAKKDGGECLNFTAFDVALLQAEGVELGNAFEIKRARKQIRQIPAGSEGEEE
jgi:hypothetical protein